MLSIGLNRAVDLFADAGGEAGGGTRGVLRTLGEHPADKKPVTLNKGRFGPYVRHGAVMASLSKKQSPDELTLDEAVVLLGRESGRRPGQRWPIQSAHSQACRQAQVGGGLSPPQKPPPFRRASRFSNSYAKARRRSASGKSRALSTSPATTALPLKKLLKRAFYGQARSDKGRGRKVAPPKALAAVAVVEISGMDADGDLPVPADRLA